MWQMPNLKRKNFIFVQDYRGFGVLWFDSAVLELGTHSSTNGPLE